MSQKSEVSLPSVKSNYIWNMLGTVSSSLISVVLLLLASRVLGSKDSEIFSIAYALGQQFFVLGYFQVRYLQYRCKGKISICFLS